MPHVARSADADELPTVERLWQVFRYDLSELTELLPNPYGRGLPRGAFGPQAKP
ncbi:hypothetical protein [Streptomyces chiangmaiensis]|uniref:Uncharacterized protein n=1 Tax=Streptomyces chiangmaiensis TaxID=766497 RepID=A0ABU7FB54_9ACTN|nr:hypothetical protein [Streptomyces chiangmaiensis]MED7821206.1 hypothetical protein [Streptomyces chiangmaiensis]